MNATVAVLLCVGIVLAGTILAFIFALSGTWISAATATALNMAFAFGTMLAATGVGVWIFGDSNWVIPFTLGGFVGGAALLCPR